MAQLQIKLPGERASGDERYRQVVFEPDDDSGSRLHFYFAVLQHDDGSEEHVLVKFSIEPRLSAEELEALEDGEEHAERITKAVMTDLAQRWNQLVRMAQLNLESVGPLEGRSAYRKTRERRKMTREFLEDIARRHAGAAANGVSPTQTIAREERVSTSTVKSWLRKARERGIEVG
jgi:hypothetical protein